MSVDLPIGKYIDAVVGQRLLRTLFQDVTKEVDWKYEPIFIPRVIYMSDLQVIAGVFHPEP